MIDSARAAALIEEWRRLEVRIIEIRRELAGDIGPVAAMTNGAQARAATTATSTAQANDPSVAPGTKSRATLEVIAELGGSAKAGPVKDALVARKVIEDSDGAEKSVRSYFNFLRKKKYIAASGERGVWELTAKARNIVGGGAQP